MNTYATERIVHERMHDLYTAVEQEQRVQRARPSRTLFALIRRRFGPLLRATQRNVAAPRAPRPNPSGRSG
jgi:hypothetical protein